MDRYEQLIAEMLGGIELKPVVLRLPVANVVPRVAETLKQMVMRHPGPLPMRVRLVNGDRFSEFELPVTVSNSIRADLRAMFGRHACEE